MSCFKFTCLSIWEVDSFPPEELCRKLSEAGLPNLFIPSLDSFLQVERMPILGTGKLDLKGLHQLALKHFHGGE